jgi:hypothetical protein
MAAFPSGKPREEDSLETVICKTCKRPVLKQNAVEHIRGCIRAKQEKARRKKEARDAANRAKEKDKDGDDDGAGGDKDGDDSIKAQKGAKKSAVKGMAEDGTKKGKKRKTEGEEDKEPKKKKKKEEPKPKAPKPKGPVDVEKQCGVILPNGAQCARSLTCKSHSMGAKRAVPGRSLPYDMLLQAYQKKNQARQQSEFSLLSFFTFIVECGELTVSCRGGHRCERSASRRSGEQRSRRLGRGERRRHGGDSSRAPTTPGHSSIDLHQEEIQVRANQGDAFSCFGRSSRRRTLLQRRYYTNTRWKSVSTDGRLSPSIPCLRDGIR